MKVGTYSGKSIENVNVLSGVEVINSPLPVNLEGVLVHLDVNGSPLQREISAGVTPAQKHVKLTQMSSLEVSS